jgi:intraflagellar transport protein 74
MDRPSSRGSLALSGAGVGKAPTGSAVPMPERPSSGMARGGGGILGAPAGGAGAGRPPGTAMRAPAPGAAGAPPGTAYKRLGTASGGRPGTGSQQAGAAGRTGTAVQVENRPITNHGVSGMKTVMGGGRRVLDKNYFVSELRQKRSEIATVTQKMRVRSSTGLRAGGPGWTVRARDRHRMGRPRAPAAPPSA